MNGNLREDRVRGLTEACRGYWRRNGVPDTKASEMSVELGDHLREALADGKGVEDVVGPDVERFAEQWAAPNRPARSLGEETLDVVSDTVFALAVLGGIFHLVSWSASVPVSAKDAPGAMAASLLLARLFAYLRAPADAPPDAEESVLDRYPRRFYDRFMWFVLALYAIFLFLPLPETVLFRWPVQATLLLPLVAVLIREAKRLITRGDAPADPPLQVERSGRPEDPSYQRINAVVNASFYWSKMRIPEDKQDDMRRNLDKHIEQAVAEGRSVRSMVGDDVEAFAEAWAQEHGAEPDHSPEPVGDVVVGWVLSFTACSAIFAAVFHLFYWSLEVPVAFVLGAYLFVVATWFGQPVADLFKRLKSWQYSPWKSMLAAGMVAMLMAAVGVVMVLVFVVADAFIPFEWPWYATAACALVALSIVAVWLRDFSRKDAERERRRTGRDRGRAEGV